MTRYTREERKARADALLENLIECPKLLPALLYPVWIDDFGSFRLGRSLDMINMIEALGFRTRA